jgi:HSP20 family protein
MALVRWNPVGQLAGMEIDRLNRMFSEFYGEGLTRGWLPPVDIFENESGEIVIKAELPDMKRDDIKVSFENHVLTLSGERKQEQTIRKDAYHRQERHVGSFSRSFTIPATVDASAIGAAYKDGVLTIRLPQREEAKPKQIAVGE